MQTLPNSPEKAPVTYSDLCNPRFFSQLYDAHAKKIYRYAVLRLSSVEDAEDILATTFLKLWEYARRKSAENGSNAATDVVSNISALIYRIARNLIVDRYRGRRSAVSLEYLGENGFEIPTSEMSSVVKAEYSAVLSAMSELSSDDRDFVVLRYVEGVSVQEIAEIFEITENNASVRLYRAIKKLRAVVNGK
ncbi:sigma-70 family RNA polymerase sigma factor [Candidatus Uhrbacteria bacterium]|nr:sigma-70 family RNA polymerase sigma factor [Candidatus Uhrbacteria bacterium]